MQAMGRAILLVVLVRLLPVTDYGAYMLLVGLSEMMLQVASFGILPVGRRYLPQLITTLPAPKLFRFVSIIMFIQIAVLCLFTFALWLVWPIITPLMGLSPEQIIAAKPAIWLFLLVPAFRFACEMLETLLEQGKSRLTAAMMAIGRITGIGLLLLLGAGIHLSSILLVDVAVTGFCLLLAYILLQHSLVSLHSATDHGEIPTREMVRFAWHMAAVDFMGSAASPGALRLALANALGVAESGLFAFLQSLQRLIGRYLPGTLLRGIVMPVLLAKTLSPGGMPTVILGTKLLLKSNFLIVCGGIVVIAVGGDELVRLLSGGKFPHAGFTLLLLFIALAFTAQRSVIEMVMQITGHTSTLRATAIIPPVSLGVIWLVADMGLNIAVLILTLATAISNGIALLVLMRTSPGFKPDWRSLFAIAIPTMISIALGITLKSDILHHINSIIATIIALAFFPVLLWISKPLNSGEFDIISKSAGSRIARLLRWLAHPGK